MNATPQGNAWPFEPDPYDFHPSEEGDPALSLAAQIFIIALFLLACLEAA